VNHKRKKVKLLLPLLAIVFSFSFLLSCSSGDDPPEGSSKSSQCKPEVGYMAPGFTLEMMKERRVVNLSGTLSDI
jgi:hypothetical protein